MVTAPEGLAVVPGPALCRLTLEALEDKNKQNIERCSNVGATRLSELPCRQQS